jgi:FixJ family two-component response regulator
MNLAHTVSSELQSLQVPHSTPIVFVVDDDISVRESLEPFIRKAGWQPETFSSAQDFLAGPRPRIPSCLLLDISLPGISGLDLQKRISSDRSEMPIIFITGCGDVAKTVQAMKAGAVEFLTKPVSNEVLLGAIKQALDRSRAALVRTAEMQELRSRYASLSPRERQVMALVVSGLLNKQIGGELGITLITVKTHRGKVMRKMKADSVANLVRMATKLRPAPVVTETESLHAAAQLVA